MVTYSAGLRELVVEPVESNLCRGDQETKGLRAARSPIRPAPSFTIAVESSLRLMVGKESGGEPARASR